MGTRKIGEYVLIKAVYDRLKAHDDTKDYSIYNNVPDDAEMPFIRVGDATGTRSAQLGAQDIEGEENAVTVHAWSDYQGDKEVAQMKDNATQAITSSALTIAGYTNVIFLLDAHNTIIDDTEPAHVVRHGWIRFICHMA